MRKKIAILTFLTPKEDKMKRRLFTVLAGIGLSVFMVSMAITQTLPPAWDLGEFAYQVSGNVGKVAVNPGGRGDVLIFPFYDVRETYGKTQTTHFAIINTDPDYGVAAKLRFREWGRGTEIFDVDVWLSANDIWVGRLQRNYSTGNARIYSGDSVIIEFDDNTFTVTNPLQNGFDFFTFPIVPPLQGLSQSDMTLMGFFEVIGEEKTQPKSLNGIVTRIYAAATVPHWDCGNTLSGYAYFVREDSIAMGYNATALVNFNRQETTRLFDGPGSILPNLKNCEDGLDQLEFELSKAEIYAGYDIASRDAKYSIVVTFPTKHLHFTGTPSDLPPFTGSSINAGENIGISVYDRSENLYTPGTPGVNNPTLPWAVNVVGLYRGSLPVLPSQSDRNNIGFLSGGFNNGWLLINLYAGAHEKYGDFNHFGYLFTRYLGMPALGLSIEEFQGVMTLRSFPGEELFVRGGRFRGGQIVPVLYREQWQPQIPGLAGD
jgi:hypothetical protein